MIKTMSISFRRAGSEFLGWFVPVAVILSLMVVWPMMAIMEGRIFPVIKPWKISAMVKSEDDQMYVYVSYTKLRSCRPAGIDWSVKINNEEWQSVSVDFNNKNSTPFRPPGKYIAGPWKIGLAWDKKELPYRVFITSNCHFLWDTITQVAGDR